MKALISLGLLPVLTAVCPAAARPQDPRLEEAFHRLYSFDFPGARSAALRYIAANGECPLGPVVVAASHLFSELNRLDALSSPVSEQKVKSGKALKPDPEARAAFWRNVGAADERARARLAAQQAVTRPQAMARRRRPWPLLAAAAALVVILAAAVIALLLRGDDESPAEDRSRALYTELAGREGAQWYTVVPGEVDPDVSGELVVSPEGDRAVIRVEELPPLTDENVFQLWLVDSEGDRSSGGLFRQAADDATYIEIPLAAPVASYQGFGVSLEPAGGSPYPDRPTGPRVFSVPLDA